MIESLADAGGRIVAAAALLAGSRIVVRHGMPQPVRGRHRRKRGSRSAPPPPIAGAAAGLLESIPYLEPVRGRRLSGTLKLVALVALLSALLAAALIGAGRAVGGWVESVGGL